MLNALYFPALRPDPAWIVAISSLVDRLICYGAVEGDQPVPGCEVRVVAPLGSERDRFLSLLREMTGREAEYFKGQLMASSSRLGRDRDEDSGWSLAAALQSSKDEATAAAREKSRIERLWQARLFLELAEKISAAEAEIHLELAVVNRKQEALLRALHGEGAEEEEPPPLSSPAVRPGPRTFRVRDLLGAWAALFSEDRQPETFLITDDREAGELLLDEVEKRAPDLTVRLPDVLIPAAGITMVLPAARVALATALAEIVSMPPAQGRIALEKALVDWNNGLAAAAGRLHCLGLYLLPTATVHQVFGALGGLAATGGGVPVPSTMLLGVTSTCKG